MLVLVGLDEAIASGECRIMGSPATSERDGARFADLSGPDFFPTPR